MNSSIFFLLAVIVVCSATIDNNTVQTKSNTFEEGFLKKLNTKCTQRDTNSCAMLKLITYMNRMLKKSAFHISDSLEVTQTREVESPIDTIESQLYARAANSDEATMSVMIADKVYRFFNSRSLKLKVFDSADLSMSSVDGNLNVGFTVNTKEAIEEGRKKSKGLLPALIAGVATKIGIMGALGLKALVILVGKAYLVSKMALFLAVILGLKKLLEKKHVTYEVVAGHGHGHGHESGWGRALNSVVDVLAQATGEPLNAQEMAYTAQKP